MANVEIYDGITLDDSTSLYDLYSRLEEGMYQASLETAPDFVTNIPYVENNDGSIQTDENGLPIVDKAKIDSGVADYTALLRKKSAYMLANAFMSVGSGASGSGSGGGGFVLRSGDNMAGTLSALYGFSAGHNKDLIFDVTHNADNKKIAHVYGSLIVDEDATIDGQLNMSNQGIYFSKHQSIYYADNALQIDSQDIEITGDIFVDGTFTLGDIIINENGLFNGDKEFYHSGNCNNKDTDWDMKDAHVYGDLTVDGKQTFNGRLTALYGFDLGENGQKLLYSTLNSDDGTVELQLASDLNLWDGYGIKFDGVYIIKVRGGSDNIVSFAAPGKIMNLGDTIDGVDTVQINLQSGIYQFNGDYEIVSKYGDGKFKNSLLAGCGNSGPTVLQTYYKQLGDCGVIFQKKIRLLGSDGPAILSTDREKLVFSVPKIHVDATNTPYTTEYGVVLSYKDTDSQFHNGTLGDTVTAVFDTDGEFFAFNKAIESEGFLINSSKFKTRLIENALFFHDGVFIEGLLSKTGMAFTGDAFFNNDVGSTRFASGFAGYGWGIIRNQQNGNIAATFDELTVRKKMRIYELEVQKQSVTNGSWWVTDSCSGDEVIMVV